MYFCIKQNGFSGMPKSIFYSIVALLLIVSSFAKAQPGALKPSPYGIFVLLNNDIPTGEKVIAYFIERGAPNGKMEKIGEARTPATFADFVTAVNKAKTVFPSQPIPSESKLRDIFTLVQRTPNLDSLRKTRLILPVKLALGVMYFDSTAQKDFTYQYSYYPVFASGAMGKAVATDTLRLPYQARFDTIRYASSSYTDNSITVTWYSIGKKPAPLFMIYKFRNYSPVPAQGQTSRYSVNDTTFYIFKDSLLTSAVKNDLQYFVSPYDQYSNSGISSQVAVVTNDNFFRAVLLKQSAAFDPLNSGVLLRWHHSDLPTVKLFTIYRSDAGKNGYVKIAEVTSQDTSFLDQKIWPERAYDYYIEATAKVGKRSKIGKILNASVPGIGTTRVTLNPPVIKLCVATPIGARLLILPNDTITNAIRVFRGSEESLINLPVSINPQGQNVVEFIDNTFKPSEMETTVYAVRNEKSGVGISALSSKVQVQSVSDEPGITYFEIFKTDNRYDFFWDDVSTRNSSVAWYAIYSKQNRPGEEFTLLSDKLMNGTFSTHIAQCNYDRVFILKAFEKNGSTVDINFPERIVSK